MKRNGILNAELAAALARLGHTHTVVIGDCGLPRHRDVPTVDLAVTFGVPSFEQVARAISVEIVTETALIASEALDANPAVVDLVRSLFGEPATLPHAQFKEECSKAQLFIRTGEASPYANVILRCGVPF
jgi:D-ribose pyranase